MGSPKSHLQLVWSLRLRAFLPSLSLSLSLFLSLSLSHSFSLSFSRSLCCRGAYESIIVKITTIITHQLWLKSFSLPGNSPPVTGKSLNEEGCPQPPQNIISLSSCCLPTSSLESHGRSQQPNRGLHFCPKGLCPKACVSLQVVSTTAWVTKSKAVLQTVRCGHHGQMLLRR